MVENEFTKTRPYQDCPRPSTSKAARARQLEAMSAEFPVGSIVQHGPLVETNAPEVYEVIAYTDSLHADYNATKRGRPLVATESSGSAYWVKDLGGGGRHGAFFVACRLLSSPFSTRERGMTTGQPPATLTPISRPEPEPVPAFTILGTVDDQLTPVLEVYESVIDGLSDENDRLSVENDELTEDLRVVCERNSQLHKAIRAERMAGIKEGRDIERQRIKDMI